MEYNGKTVAIIVAAGSGTRAGSEQPKQFRHVRGRSLIAHCHSAFASHSAIDEIVLVIAEGQQEIARHALAGFDLSRPLTRIVSGGASRRDSVRNAIQTLQGDDPPARVLIHDAARPFLPQDVITRLLDALKSADGAIPVLPVVDTVARADGDKLGGTVPRDPLRRVQTPQAFRFPALAEGHAQWSEDAEATDDAQMVRAAGGRVSLVKGDEALRKLTYASDFEEDAPAMRVGFGYDVHQLAEGEDLWLCGVKIAHDQGLAGHSDADVAIHALVDGILGAVAAGDIGQHFPPSDPQWRGASSDQFLSHAVMLAAQAGYRPGNLDVTIVCEAPRIGPYRQAMRERLAEILGVDIGAVSVKATTTERLGFTGRGEGIAANAVVSLTKI